MNFAFIHIYKDILFGKILTYSIKLHHPNSSVIQISDLNAKKIEDVDYIERKKFYYETIMYDFIKAQRDIINKYGPTVFLDADMIVLKPITEFFSIENYEFSVTQRTEENKQLYFTPVLHKEKFPELIGKKFGDEMPFNAGIYFCKNSDTLKYMLSIFNKLKSNYYEWYGDQLALRELVKINKFKIKIFNDYIYNYTPNTVDEDLSDKKVLHFKGKTKKLLVPIFKKIFNK